MAHALTEYYERVIDRLLRMGIFANRSEAVRAGLKELEEKYLQPARPRLEPLPQGALERAYRKHRTSQDQEELQAARASRRRSPTFDE